MDSRTLIESFQEFAKFKNIDRPTMIRILEDVFRTLIKKKYEEDADSKKEFTKAKTELVE